MPAHQFDISKKSDPEFRIIEMDPEPQDLLPAAPGIIAVL